MALGGGTFLVQNKVLPGAYINFVSASRASATLSDRGYGAMALELDWGPDNEIFTVENADFQKDSLKIFGYDYTNEKLKGLRDLYKNLKTGYLYKLNGGVKASNDYAVAKYKGIRGNDLKIIIVANVDDNNKFDVSTLIDTTLIDTQTVAQASDLKSNDFVDFNVNATLAVTAGAPLTDGTNGNPVTGTEYQTFLDKIESYSFNTLGCLSTAQTVIDLYVVFTKRMRDEVGAKFQTIVYRTESDYEGIISIENNVTDSGANTTSLIYWLTGAEAGCEVNKTITNKKYDGEFTVDTNYKQTQLSNGIKAGKLLFHKVGDEVRILTDINTFVSFTDAKNKDFSKNQTIRVLDQIANDTAVLFNTKYLGKAPNDASGRIAFWSDIVFYNRQLQQIRAITNFESKDVVVDKGNDKDSVVTTQHVTPVNAMEKLYMTVIVE
ncbi:phage tail sheath protein [Clostridium puniceum]|uniref:Phage tail sheath protein n=1 Tax=Clostridium puniceum TaxID=29367 RepID=A0A1S8TXK0_9CLOT|nr:phage tail sheath family protein [Clostridium puniceum]OOM82329.1 phage tail sheath protein [Clostridium puniceum]